MYDGGAGKIVESEVGEPAAAPDPVAGHGIHDGDEQRGKEDVGLEFDAFGDGAGDDGGGGGGEHQLEEEFGFEGHAGPGEGGEHALVAGAVREGTVIGAGEEETVETDECGPVAEHEGEPGRPEHERGDGHDDEVLGEDVDRVF